MYYFLESASASLSIGVLRSVLAHLNSTFSAHCILEEKKKNLKRMIQKKWTQSLRDQKRAENQFSAQNCDVLPENSIKSNPGRRIKAN